MHFLSEQRNLIKKLAKILKKPHKGVSINKKCVETIKNFNYYWAKK